MNQLNLTLLGMPQIKVDDEPITNLPSRKARALLIYLALSRQTHSRQHLAGFLWGEMTEEKARRNLRVLLTRLRKQLEPFLNIQRRELGINLDSDVWIDVDEFETCLAPAEPTLQQLHRAAKLYQGHFLDGFALREAPMFEEWQRPLQERYRQLAMDALYRLAVYHTQQKQYGMGIDFTGQLLGLEPWMEEAHRQMMLLQALSGQRTAALTQYETCRDILLAEIGVEPSEATVTLYQQILNEEIDADIDRPTIIPATKADQWKPPFLPPALPPHFVGRVGLQDKITAVLQASQSPQIHGLVGMGGVGKSALAAQLAHALRDNFADGVLWANVAGSEPMSILESWAQLYGYDFTRIADVESMAAAFRGVLAEKSVLIVLDDVTSAARIRPLLPTGDYNHVLLTTRDQDLAHALHATVWPLAELSQENGRLLFSQLLGEDRVNAEPEATDDICNLLQNLPLAVEITAQRLKSRPRRRLVDMAARLEDETKRLSLLKISDQGVRASFGVSWETLDEGLRQVFQVMGLFNGRSFTAEAIAHIVDQDPYLTEDRIYTLTTLSLVSEEGQTRYRQHALLADFAREKLEEGEENGLSPRRCGSRLSQHYLQFAQRHPHDYDILRPEWDNLMAAMETAHDHQLWQTVIDFADALHDAWFTRARYTQARHAFQKVHQATLQIGDERLLAKNWLRWGVACIEQGDYEEAKNILANSLNLYKQFDDLLNVANVQVALARIAMNQSKYSEAQLLFAASRKIKEALGDLSGLAKIIEGQARVLHRQWHYDEAHQLILEALSMQKAVDNKIGTVQTIRLLIDIELALHKQIPRRLDALEKYCNQALALCRKLQDQGELAVTLYSFSRVKMAQGDLEEANRIALESVSLLEYIGDRRSQAIVLGYIALIKEEQNNYEAAIEAGRKSLTLLQRLGDKTEIARTHLSLGFLYYSIDQSKQAATNWTQALEVAEKIEHEALIKQINGYIARFLI